MAAGLLQRIGIDVPLYEVAPTLTPVGAGIMMAPNAMHVFESLEVVEPTPDILHEINR